MTTEIQAGLEAAQKAEEYVRRAALVRQYEGNPDLEPNPAKRARAEDRAQFWEQQARELAPELSRLQRAISRLQTALEADHDQTGQRR
jgi:hypothetical protein